MLSSKTADAMALHSMCHPGLPSPHGDDHTGSPGLLVFHNTKSCSCFFKDGPSSVVKAPSPSAKSLESSAPSAGGTNLR